MIYKIIAKTITNRLKTVLPLLIDESQSGLVLERLIIDNAIIAFEIFYWLKEGHSIGEIFMAVELDMSKTHDRVE